MKDRHVYQRGGIIEDSHGLLVGTVQWPTGPDNTWQPPGPPKHYRKQGQFIEVGEEYGYPEDHTVTWERVLKLGAAAGDTWDTQHNDVVSYATHYRLTAFGTFHGEEAAAITKWYVLPGAGSLPSTRFEELSIYVRGVGLVLSLTESDDDGTMREANRRILAAATITDGSAKNGLPKLRLGVTESQGANDDLPNLLSSLGEGYKHTLLDVEDLQITETIRAYDVLFLTSSGIPATSMRYASAQNRAPDVNAPRSNEAAWEVAAENLRHFVEEGGTLYASNLQYDLVARAFPEITSKTNLPRGRSQSLDAEVVDEGLREAMGATVQLRFKEDGWRPAAFEGKGVTVLARSKFMAEDGNQYTGPIIIKGQIGNGTVIFTSFHHREKNSEIEGKLIRWLLFATITAPIERGIVRNMQSNWSPIQTRVFATSFGEPSGTSVYHSKNASSAEFVGEFRFGEGPECMI